MKHLGLGIKAYDQDCRWIEGGAQSSIVIKVISQRQGRQTARRFIGLLLIKIGLVDRRLPAFSRLDSLAGGCLLFLNKIADSLYIEIDIDTP